MSINRRLFLKSSCGAVVAVVASQTLFSGLFSDPGSIRTLVKNTVMKRFPQFDFSGGALDEFADMMAARDLLSEGAAGIALADILDEDTPTVTFERYVMREFLLNTNYLSHKSANFPGLKFSRFGGQDLNVA